MQRIDWEPTPAGTCTAEIVKFGILLQVGGKWIPLVNLDGDPILFDTKQQAYNKQGYQNRDHNPKVVEVRVTYLYKNLEAGL